MIKFFRRIRYNLLKTRKTGSSTEASAKTGRYFKYAIGEIVLVVIGILIALQINNWNEAKKDKNSLHLYLSVIKENIENDLIVLDSLKTTRIAYTNYAKKEFIQNFVFLKNNFKIHRLK